MSCKDIAELLSQYKKPEQLSVQQYAACFISGARDKTVKVPHRKFLVMTPGEIEQYTDMFKKIMKPREYGDRILTCKAGCTERLQDIIDKEMTDEEQLQRLYDTINDSYSTAGGFAVFLFYGVYDIADQNGGDSEYSYKHLICIICPAEYEEPGLKVSTEGFEMKERRIILKAPDTAFIYPAFVNHSEDREQIMFYNADPLNMQEELMQEWVAERTIPTSEYIDDVYNAVWAVYGDKKTTERITNEFGYRMSLLEQEDQKREINDGTAAAVLKLCGCTDLAMIEKRLEKDWYILPTADQLYTDRMIKKHRAVSAHDELIRTLENSARMAEHAGNFDLREQIEEQISKEKMKE